MHLKFLIIFIFFFVLSPILAGADTINNKIRIAYQITSDDECKNFQSQLDKIIKEEISHHDNFEERQVGFEKRDSEDIKEKAKESGIDKVVSISANLSDNLCVIILKIIDISRGEIEKIATLRVDKKSSDIGEHNKKQLIGLLKYNNSNLKVLTKPTDCEVIVNKKTIGKSPINQFLAVEDDYEIEVIKDGFITYKTSINLFGKENHVIDIELENLLSNQNEIQDHHNKSYSIESSYQLSFLNSDIEFAPYHFVSIGFNYNPFKKIVVGGSIDKSLNSIILGSERIFGNKTQKKLSSSTVLAPYVWFAIQDKKNIFWGPFISPNIKYTTIQLLQSDALYAEKNPFVFAVEGGIKANLKIIPQLSLVFGFSYTYSFAKDISFLQEEQSDTATINNLPIFTFEQGLSFSF